MTKRLSVVFRQTDGRAPAVERRLFQRRLGIARRVQGSRRLGVEVSDRPFDGIRRPFDRRGIAARRRMLDRRTGLRVLDLRNLDLTGLEV
ncbi:MAG: hypothetical protein ABI592_13275 [Acidobacteriota bacterium]